MGFGKLSDPGHKTVPEVDGIPPWCFEKGRFTPCPDCSGLKEKITKAKERVTKRGKK